MSVVTRYLALAPGSSTILDDVCRIYEAAFPITERKPTAALREVTDQPDYQLIVATARETVAGFAAVFAPPCETFALLEYLAVDEPWRGHGVGAELLRAALEAVVGASLLIEVEALDGGGVDRDARERRQAFYRRLGCRRVAGLEYQLPLRVGGVPPPMHLFVHHDPQAPPLRRDALGRAVRSVYVRVYGQSSDDPRIAGMLAPVGDPVEFD